LVSAPGQSYSYDGASRLTRANGVVLAYNGLDDVISRTAGETETRFYYNYAISMAPICAEGDNRGEIKNYYVWSPGGRLLYMINAAEGRASFFHFDRAGSTLALTDDTGQVTDAYAYSPYGRLLGREGNTVQAFTFIGRYGVRAEGSDLYQMRARYYSAALGSFLTRDPLPPRFEDIHSLNPYHYAAGDPLRSVDPEGLDRTIWFFGHAWIEVDTYDAQGRKTGRLALNFAPESDASDFQIYQPRGIIYPHLLSYTIESSQLEDELLLREWKRLRADPNRAQQWNPLKNCVWRSIEYANMEIPMTAQETRKFIDATPLPSGLSFNAAPPPPWYERPFVWIGDTWGEFEEWLEEE
jgi:RHS repeat-associated protein